MTDNRLKDDICKVLSFAKYILLIIAFAFFSIGHIINNFNIMLLGVLSLFISNIFYTLLKYKTHIILLFFHLTFFTFILSRPTISMLRGKEWWYFEYNTVCFAVNAIFITLLALHLGAFIADQFQLKKKYSLLKPKIDYDKSGFNHTLQKISLIFFIFTLCIYIISEIEKLIYMQGKDYYDYYTSYKSTLPSVLLSIADMRKYALCIFLATLPSKKQAFIPLAFYVLSAIPSLIIGMRNPIVLNIIFVFLYYLLRDILEKKENWFGKFEKTAVIVAIPFALVFLSMLNYTRDNLEVQMSAWDSIVDLFYKQGVSFDVLCKAYDALPYLPNAVPKNYTFGGFIDYITHGTIAQKLFGAIDLGSQNSELLATYGNNFAHSMSFVAHPEYLQGHGWGSSYILETFADGGYLGLIVFSIIFGFAMVLMVTGIRHGTLLRAIVFTCFLNLFFTPRSSATGWLTFIITIQFWFTIAFCFMLAHILSRNHNGDLNLSYNKTKISEVKKCLNTLD